MRTVLYLRLSDEDRDKLSKEEKSESIKNQEKILKNYAKENNWDIIGVYQDEDYSGADRDRPNFNKMIHECKCGNVDIVLVKSQARFARDIELIDKYVHNLFYEWNVRFMTYLEKIDNSKLETKKASQITSMIDEWYIEDTSINIRETLKAKRENGEFTGSFAPYGYKKDPLNKNHLIVDSIVSNIIKRIYFEYADGIGLQTIANTLNKENILSPLEYKKANGSKLKIPITKNCENYKFMKQTGYYKIDILYQQDKNSSIITYHYFKLNNTITNNPFEIILTNSTNNIDFYYTTKKINEKKFNTKDWIKVNIGDAIPIGTTCIATNIKESNENSLISYQFEIFIKENKKKDEYFLILIHYNNDTKINLNYQLKIRKKYKWSSQTIKKILTNEFYIGNLVQFKSTHVSYKNHTVIHNSPSKWIRVNNTHDAIIDYNLWNLVQNKLHFKNRSNKTGHVHPLSNKIFCLYCNKPFIKCGKKDINGYSYLCCKDKKDKWNNCINKKYIKEKDIHTLLLNKINSLITKYYDENIIKNMKEKNLELNFQENKKEEINTLLKELKEKENYFSSIYENYIKNILNIKEFHLLKEKYENDIKNINYKLSILNGEKKINKRIIPSKNNLKLKQLDNYFINLFVDKIYIGLYTEKTNSREIKIIWDFTIKE